MILHIFFQIYFIKRRFVCWTVGRWKFHVLLHYGVHRDSSVNVVTGLIWGLVAKNRGSIRGSGKGFRCSPQRPVQLWGSPVPCKVHCGVKADGA